MTSEIIWKYEHDSNLEVFTFCRYPEIFINYNNNNLNNNNG